MHYMTSPNFMCAENITSYGSTISRNIVLECCFLGLVLKPSCGLLGLSRPGAHPFSTSSLDTLLFSLCALATAPTRPHSFNTPCLCMSYVLSDPAPRKMLLSHKVPSQVHPSPEAFPGPRAEVIPSAFGCQCLDSTTLWQLPHLGATLLAFHLSLALSLRTVMESYQCPQPRGYEVRFEGIQISQDFKYLFHFLLSKLDYN